MTNSRRGRARWRSSPNDNPFVGLSRLEKIDELRRRARARWWPNSTEWVHELCDLASRHDLELDVIRPCTLELAQLAHAHDHVVPTEADWQRWREDLAALRVLTYVLAHRLRLDLKFHELASVVDRAISSDPRLAQDALIRSLKAFAELGLGSPQAVEILQQITGMPDYDRWCRAVCLHGLGVADHLSDQGERIITLCAQMSQGGEIDADLHYWHAFGLRRQGKFVDALAAIDRALAQATPRSARHDAFLLERDLIRTSRAMADAAAAMAERATTAAEDVRAQFQLHESALKTQFEHHERALKAQLKAHQEELKAELEQQTEAARRLVPDSVLGMVCMLGVGAVLVGFLVATVIFAIVTDNPWGRSLWILGLLVGGVGLVVVMRWLAEPDWRSGRRRKTE